MSALRATTGLVAAIDARLSRLAEQGRTGPHQGCTGEEAALCGLAAAAQSQDWLFWGRQVLVPALLRGLSTERLFALALGDEAVAAEVAALRIVARPHGPAARLPHATGLAAAARKDGVVALCELGDGAISDGEFHTGLNFAGVMNAPVVFVVRSGGVTGVVGRGEGYGVREASVSGADAHAVREVVSEQVERARRGEGPALVEVTVERGQRLPRSVVSAREDEVEAALGAALRAFSSPAAAESCP